MAKSVELKIEHGIGYLTLANGEKGNPLDLEFGGSMLSAAIELEGCSELRAVLLSAEGPNFSVGGNLKTFAKIDDLPTYVRESTAQYHAAISRLLRLSAPIVSSVQGACAGAGMGLAALGDIVVAAQSSYFTSAYTAIGFSPDGASTYILPRVIGLRKYQELVLTNRRIDADEALQIGLVTQVAADGENYDQAEKIAKQLAKGPTNTFGTTKRLLLETFDNSMETQLALESKLLSDLCTTEDTLEGIAAATQSRPAQFKGN